MRVSGPASRVGSRWTGRTRPDHSTASIMKLAGTNQTGNAVNFMIDGAGRVPTDGVRTGQARAGGQGAVSRVSRVSRAVRTAVRDSSVWSSASNPC